MQLAYKEALYSVSFKLWAEEPVFDVGSACVLSGLLLHLSAHFGHGLLQLREAVLRVPCQVHAFAASMCLVSV